MESKGSKKTSSGSGIGTAYLFLYNLALAVGWTITAVVAVYHCGKKDSYVGLFSAIQVPLFISQTAALLEIVHCSVGLVRSSPFLTGIQVLSRVYLIWGPLYMVPEAQDQIGVLLITIAWSITEIIRYTFYMGSLGGYVPYPMLFLRYSTFIILYPIGVFGELTCVWYALPHVKEREILSVNLPNFANMSFSFYYALIVISLLYLPFFPQLYGHMLSQRKKVLGSESSRAKAE